MRYNVANNLDGKGEEEMRTIRESPNLMPTVDDDGFVVDAQTWTPEVAQVLSEEEVPNGLTSDHWKVIIYLRQYYLDFASVPPVRKLSRETGFTLREMKRMFPNGLTQGACKIAGIPHDVIKPSFLYP